jgi:hypothetical protein
MASFMKQLLAVAVVLLSLAGSGCGAATSSNASAASACAVTWSDWSNCTAPCGWGTQSKVGTLTLEASADYYVSDAELETFDLVRTRPCNAEACVVDVDCEVTWSEWSPCSVPCDGGVQLRFAEVTVAAQNNGTACPELHQLRACDHGPCHGKRLRRQTRLLR